MNTRVLELLKNPKNIQSEDLGLLQEEINSYPYIQSIRALHLYGVHLFDKDNYKKALSATAAYTTDKKILYQLINGKPINFPKPFVPEEETMIIDHTPSSENFKKIEEDVVEPISEVEVANSIANEVCDAQPLKKGVNKEIFINGERNRILFEGEEEFLNENFEIKKPITDEVVSIAQIQEGKVEDLAPIDGKHLETKVEDAIENIDNEELLINPIDHSQNVISGLNDHQESEVESQLEQEPSTEIESSTVELIFNPETIINDSEIEDHSAEEIINDESELSFHGTDAFLPEVKIEASKPLESPVREVEDTNINKHEEEMRRLIEAVEKRMKTQQGKSPFRRSAPKEEELSTDINFTETQRFEVLKAPSLPVENTVEEETDEVEMIEEIAVEHSSLQVQDIVEEPIVSTTEEISMEIPESEQEEPVSTWKPMNFETNLPDSLINKKPEPISEIVANPEVEVIQNPESNEVEKTESIDSLPAEVAVITSIDESIDSEIDANDETIDEVPTFEKEKVEENLEMKEEEETEVPVLNFSFFGSEISSLKINKEPVSEEPKLVEDIPTPIIEEKVQEQVKPVDSNVPGFINTWQSWLKIDRTEEEVKPQEVDLVEVKNKAIENFIETNPKISQLKEEVTYVVKEKNDDISHLMTETLATLYVEQKLYAKAIKAFKTLIGKYPDKKDYFEAKIKEVKEIRGRN